MIFTRSNILTCFLFPKSTVAQLKSVFEPRRYLLVVATSVELTLPSPSVSPILNRVTVVKPPSSNELGFELKKTFRIPLPS